MRQGVGGPVRRVNALAYDQEQLRDESQSGHPPILGGGIIHGMTVFHWCCPTCYRATGISSMLVLNIQFFNKLKERVIRKRTECNTSPMFVARAPRRCCDWPNGPSDAEGVVDTTSKRREGVRPVTAHGSASAAVHRWNIAASTEFAANGSPRFAGCVLIAACRSELHRPPPSRPR